MPILAPARYTASIRLQRRGGRVSPEATMGIVSVILWSLLLIVAFKYAILIMRADNRSEGGIVALLEL
jgi:KUP system potassium uptake protein